MTNAYDLKTSLPNKLIQNDGTITDITGSPVSSSTAEYNNKPALPNKFLNPDGSYSTLNEIIASMVDTSIYVIVDELPNTGNPQKIYLVPDGNGNFTEYHWTGTKWDPIGMLEFDLSNYSTTEQVQSMIATALQSAKDYTDTQLSHFVPMQSFPDSFVTDGTTTQFFNSINAIHPSVGSYYLGLVTLSDMPEGLLQAEVQVSVYPNNVLYATMRSADLEPYVWEANSYDFEGWVNHNTETLTDANTYTDTAIRNSITNVLGGEY